MNIKATKYLAGVAAMGLVCSVAIAETLPAPEHTGPPGNVTFPAAFTAFDLSAVVDANLTPAAGTPEIAEWIRSNGPGDSMVLSGAGFSTFAGDAEGRDTRFRVYGKSGGADVLADGLINRQAGLQLTLTFPDELPENEMYLVWPRNSEGYGLPVAVNQAEAWWLGLGTIAAGSEFSVFGRNLQLGAGSCFLYIEELDLWLESSSANPYKADFTLPSNVGEGSYTVWVHNGHGGNYGWSPALALEVADELEFSNDSATWINVKDYGAKGDGSTDDYDAIGEAIDDCPSGGTIYFPAGTYPVRQRIYAGLGNKRVLGAGPQESVITTHSSYSEDSAYGMFHSSLSGTVFENIGLAGGSSNVGKLLRCRKSQNSRLINCRFSQLNSSSTQNIVDFHKSENLTIENCEFIFRQAPYLTNCDGLYVKECKLYGFGDVTTGFLLDIGGADNASVMDCIGGHYDNSDYTDGHGWCQGRFIYGSGNNGASRHVYIGGNSATDMAPRFDWDNPGDPGHQNAGEMLLWEHTRTKFRGAVTAASANTVTSSGLSSSLAAGQMITVVSGRGFGQSRFVNSVDDSSGTATLSEAWQVIPDSSSIIMAGSYCSRIAVYQNTLDGVERVYDPDFPSSTASAGVSFYGGSSDTIVDSNSFSEIEDAIVQWSMIDDRANVDGFVCEPNYFNLYTRNTVSKCQRAMRSIVPSVASAPAVDIGIYGTVFRANTFSEVTAELIRAGTGEENVTICGMVYEHNTATSLIENLGSVEIDSNLVLRNNVFIGDQGGDGLSYSGSQEPFLHNNAISGFSPLHSGSAMPDKVLEMPCRVIQLTGAVPSGSLTVLNGGVEAMSWSASSSAAWLEVTAGSGQIADESATGTLSFRVNTSASPADEDEAVITVTGGGDTRQITVLYSADGTSEPTEPGTPPPAVLTGLAISGPTDVDEGASAQYSCTATYSDGTTQAAAANWSESFANAGIDASGLLSAGNVDVDETATITATFGGQVDTLDVTINYIEPVLTGLEIIGPASVNEGASAQYSCTASWSDGTTENAVASWSENSAHAAISSTGLLSASDVDADQSVTVTASFGGLSATKSVTIAYNAPVLTGIAISGPSSMDEESSVQYSCIATWSDGSSLSIEPSWSASDPALISASGLLSAGDLADDQYVTVSASYGGQSDSHTVLIIDNSPELTGLAITAPAELEENCSTQLVCTASYADGSTEEIAPTWSLVAANAAINGDGLLSVGNIDADEELSVTATFGGETVSVTLTAVTVGTHVVFPLSGFDGETVRAELWDNTAQEWRALGESVGPAELVVADVESDRWYWLCIEQYDASLGDWVQVHANWLSM